MSSRSHSQIVGLTSLIFIAALGLAWFGFEGSVHAQTATTAEMTQELERLAEMDPPASLTDAEHAEWRQQTALLRAAISLEREAMQALLEFEPQGTSAGARHMNLYTNEPTALSFRVLAGGSDF